MERCDGGLGVEPQGAVPSHLHLRPANVALLEEKLPVQVAHLNRVEVNLQGEEEAWSSS